MMDTAGAAATEDGLVQQKVALREKIKVTEVSDIGWFEPASRFVRGLKQATLVASTGNDIQKRELLKKLGLNFAIVEKRLNLNLTEPWKIIENHSRFAHERTAALLTSAAVRGETNQDFTNAETMIRRSNALSLLHELDAHFQSNPVWE